jgi:hypothetical protein
MIDLKNSSFYFSFVDIIDRNRILNIVKKNNIFIYSDYLILNRNIPYLIYSNNYISDKTTFYDKKYYVFENESTFFNTIKIIKTLKSFTYLQIPDNFFECFDLSRLLTKFVFNSKELIVIKDLDTNAEYIVTEKTTINCTSFFIKC